LIAAPLQAAVGGKVENKAKGGATDKFADLKTSMMSK